MDGTFEASEVLLILSGGTFNLSRFTPGIFNTDKDIDNTLRAIKELG